ncbi:FAD-dependent 5-carboxymethylaminomethyl-2-thiouridine(34) oxidoreductase MnmC [Caulobacter mirabilis]|uniref:tRNA 5-methylaminomethyl-2-thiouridine biosynthesis bifunctional protein MnmC n=1 Tax=Caulobacter mirabilis TaxID=69666 RepID=A0A2D2ATK6_9CAUL|nr:FAD-dependent 5-carboxymethylaminomethyl-2-thiouridine(34) oxidoreductase MnmC [Caulobacter mirabilis]ATQ41340.1 FAD-dependent cmnm(5)s(2)U34 oxidoreductase [Caulobacter mirabilis]
MTAAPPIDPALTWGEDGLPRSGLYGDVYFSSDDGLAETRAVFLAGADLPHAWRDRERFVIGELGFGTGLNIAALLDLWRRERPPGGRLHVFSVERHPLAVDDAARALARWPELEPVAAPLLAAWPRRARGFHRLDLPNLDAVIDLAVMDAAEALTQWQGRADAWFLDGFAPASNPAMWRQEVLDLVAARSAPGARVATFTVAGAVRRGLQAAGFAVEKRPGFGRKRERLEASMPGGPAPVPPRRRVAVIGAGIAGASLARAFRLAGAAVEVFDPRGAGGGASGNPAALVSPRVDASLGPVAALYAQAQARSADLYRATPDVVISEHTLLLERTDRDGARFRTVADSDLFAPGSVVPLDQAETAALADAPGLPGGVLFKDGLVIEPAPLLAAWAGTVRRESVARLESIGAGWRLRSADDALLAEVDIVCLAAGHRSTTLLDGPPLQPIRGQASWTTEARLGQAISFGGYAAPTRDGLLFGATHDRDRDDETLDPADHQRNLAQLATLLPDLAGRLDAHALQGRASVRAATADRLPLAGRLADNAFVLAGLGSRGFCLAPLLAEHLVALALGHPSPLPEPLGSLIDPVRFARRARRKTSS